MKTFLKECKWGRFLLLEGDMISKYVHMYGEWSELEVELYRNLLKENSNVIEVGANIGMHTIPLSRIANTGKVICFEPQRIIFQILSANCALNNRTNVFAEHMAVGNANGDIDIECSDYDLHWNYGAFSIEKGYSSEAKFVGPQWSEQVEMVRLDDHPLMSEIDSLDLLKIDVEGLEVDVLAGASEVINSHRPALFVENNNQEKGDELIDTIRSLDYESFWYCTERYTPQNYNREPRNIGGFDINMISVPAEKKIDLPALDRVQGFDDLINNRVRWVKRDVHPAL